MNALKKEEKLTILITSILIFSMVILVLYKKTLVDSMYESQLSNDAKFFQNFEINNDIKFEVFEEISDEVTYYLKGNSELLELVELDINEVDNQKTGKYYIKAIYNSEYIQIPVNIIDSIAPEIYVNDNNFVWTLESYETVQDIMNYVNVTVQDNYDKNLTVKEWIKELPTEPGIVKYPIYVEDSNGNATEYEIVITYVF